ncbi:MAG TPA: hypothetical protein VEW48_02825 [Thermoanaerobaculia bacterium]|nr:hypothetical protein [Thermoanaerobaculia bacterium]
MKLSNKSAWKSLLLVLTLLASFASGACRVRQTQEGKVPEVEVKGGQVPKYDVDAPDIQVKTEKREVEVPVVKVNPPRDDHQVSPGTPQRPPQP